MRQEIISSYILRLTRKGQELKVGLQNVKTGHVQQFESIEALIAHLEQIQLNFADLLQAPGTARAPPELASLKPDKTNPEPPITLEFGILEPIKQSS